MGPATFDAIAEGYVRTQPQAGATRSVARRGLARPRVVAAGSAPAGSSAARGDRRPRSATGDRAIGHLVDARSTRGASIWRRSSPRCASRRNGNSAAPRRSTIRRVTSSASRLRRSIGPRSFAVHDALNRLLPGDRSAGRSRQRAHGVPQSCRPIAAKTCLTEAHAACMHATNAVVPLLVDEGADLVFRDNLAWDAFARYNGNRQHRDRDQQRPDAM